MAQMIYITKEPGHTKSGSAPLREYGVVKTCSKCKEEKSISEFRERSNGCHESWCNWRKSGQNKNRYKTDPEYRRQQIDRSSKRQRLDPEDNQRRQKRWRDNHPDQKRSRERRYAEQNRSKLTQKESRRRAKKLNVFIEDVDPDFVFERDNGVCGICSKPVVKSAMAIDHIIPLARGGDHSYNNVQLAHPWCNSKKGYKLKEEME
jgi:5-methylcytosine-specific restriction endonuclease McrA